MTARYSCEDVFRRLDDYLDRELAPEDMRRVAEHLETCVQCAGEHQFEARVLADVRNKLRRIRAPAQLVDRVARAVSALRQLPADDGPPA